MSTPDADNVSPGRIAPIEKSDIGADPRSRSGVAAPPTVTGGMSADGDEAGGPVVGGMGTDAPPSNA